MPAIAGASAALSPKVWRTGRIAKSAAKDSAAETAINEGRPSGSRARRRTRCHRRRDGRFAAAKLETRCDQRRRG